MVTICFSGCLFLKCSQSVSLRFPDPKILSLDLFLNVWIITLFIVNSEIEGNIKIKTSVSQWYISPKIWPDANLFMTHEIPL